MGSDNAIIGKNRYFAFCAKSQELAKTEGSYEALKLNMMGADLRLLGMLYEKVDRITGRIVIEDIYRKVLREDDSVKISAKMKSRDVTKDLTELGRDQSSNLEWIYVEAFNFALRVLEKNQAKQFLRLARMQAEIKREQKIGAIAEILAKRAELDFNAEYFMEPDSIKRFVKDKLGPYQKNHGEIVDSLLACYRYARLKPAKGRSEIVGDSFALLLGRITRHKPKEVEMNAQMEAGL